MVADRSIRRISVIGLGTNHGEANLSKPDAKVDDGDVGRVIRSLRSNR
jgi:hypothetical protein